MDQRKIVDPKADLQDELDDPLQQQNTDPEINTDFQPSVKQAAFLLHLFFRPGIGAAMTPYQDHGRPDHEEGIEKKRKQQGGMAEKTRDQISAGERKAGPRYPAARAVIPRGSFKRAKLDIVNPVELSASKQKAAGNAGA